MRELTEQEIVKIIDLASNEIYKLEKWLEITYEDFTRKLYKGELKQYKHIRELAEELLKTMKEVNEK